MKTALMIWYGAILHLVWGLMLMASPTVLGVTAVNSILSFGIINANTAGAFYILVALMALIGLNSTRKRDIILLIPQSLLLLLSAYGAINAMILGQFADGVVRPFQFLIADQSPAVITAILHMVAVVAMYREKV